MASTIQVRVDDDLKEKAEALFRDLGTDTTTAIRMFLTQAVAIEGFPFEIKRVKKQVFAPLSEEQIFTKLEKARLVAEEGNYRPADEVTAALREKYDL